MTTDETSRPIDPMVRIGHVNLKIGDRCKNHHRTHPLSFFTPARHIRSWRRLLLSSVQAPAAAHFQ